MIREASLALVIFGLVSPAQAINLVKDGQPAATIVISEAALKSELFKPARGSVGPAEPKIKLAALDLQTFLQKMSGAKLPIVSDAGDTAGALILVGPSKMTQEVKGLAIPSGLTRERKEDAYVILCRGNTLVLAGNDAGPYHGTHYAVAEFLNRLGVRWILPGEFGEVVPRKATLSFDDLAFTDRPTFRFRTWWCNQPADMGATEALWKLRNKMQIADTAVIAIPGDSHLRQFMPDKSLMETKPEIFGKSFDQSPFATMPNLSNPESAKLVAEKVIERIRKSAEAGQPIDSVGFAPDDGLPMDHTPETIKELNQGFVDWVGREGVVTELSASEEWFIFMNRVVEEVAMVYPDVIISTNGYANRCNPPEGMKLHPNMAIMYAPIWADTLKPFYHPKSWHSHLQAMQVKRWCELNSRVFLYNYNLTMLVTLLTPVPQVQKMAINYPLYHKWGLFGFFNESKQPYMEEGIATRYMRTKLMWNANLDVPQVLGDYFANWYGPAAQPASAFWKAIEDCILESPLLGHEDRILPYVYTPELLKTLEEQVSEAEKLAANELFKTHVKIDRLTLEHLKAYMEIRAAEFDARYGDAVKHLARMADLRLQLNGISPFIAMPPARSGIERIYSGEHYYGVLQRSDHFQNLHDMTTGKTGDLVALLPKTARFTLDEAGMGKDLRWHAPEFDRSKWRDIDTTKPFYIQGYLSDMGVPYQGKMWYAFDLDVPANFAGKPIHLYTPIVTSEAWVWVNGEYSGHRKYMEAYIRPAPIDMDVTSLLKPGKKNTIAIWVSTGANRTQASDGIMGRVLLYSPKK